MTTKYTILGLDCASCAQKVENKLNKREDIEECVINFAQELLIIDSKQELDIKELESFIQKIESEVTLTKRDNRQQTHHDEHKHEHQHDHKPDSEYCCDDDCCCHEHHEHDHDDCCDDDDCCCHGHHEHEHDDCCDDDCCCHEHHAHEHDGCCDDDDCCCHEHHEHVHDQRSLKSADALSFSIIGLDCANCAMKVEKAIAKMDIIDEAIVNFSTETLQVSVHSHIEEQTLINEIQKTIDSVEEGVTLSSKNQRQPIEKAKLFVVKDQIPLIIGVVIYIISLFFENGPIGLFGFLLSYVFIGREVLFKAFKNILRGEIFDENFLMVLATLGAFIIGDYPEAVAVLLFYSIGEIFQAYAVNKTRHSISSLMDIKSEYANIKTNDGTKKVAPEDVSVGDILVVKVGEKVPLDGRVVKGQSSLDTSSLTGESVPREIHEDEEVLAGVVNLTEILEVEVTKPYHDSTVARILELMENAASKKAPIERFITRFARVYTPTVVALAVLLAIVPVLFIKNALWSEWLYRACTFLVVSCPCALVISIPLGLYAGLGKASKLGALIKGGNYLELLKDVDTVVFDKTGTLTHGYFDVIEVNGSEDLLMYGAYGEYYSNHPIAQSIVRKYNQRIDEHDIQEFKEIAGKGIDVMIKGQHVLLGNASFFEERGLTYQEPQSVGTIVYVAIDDQYAGSIVVADQIKESAIQGIRALKESGIKKTVMLTGDHHQVALDVAGKLGIDTVMSELLPQDKVSKVEELIQNETGYVAFVGDGINDAPVLARADVGIAMGGVGSDAAIEAADVVLMQDNIETIKDAISISYKTNRILKQNVTFTLIIKIGVLVLAPFGLANMWMGVFADVGVTLIAILNAMRILR